MWTTIKGFRRAKKVQEVSFRIVRSLCPKCTGKANELIKQQRVMEMGDHICKKCFAQVQSSLIELKNQVTMLNQNYKKLK